MVTRFLAIRICTNPHNHKAMFFPKNKYDREFVERILTEKQIAYSVEAARQ